MRTFILLAPAVMLYFYLNGAPDLVPVEAGQVVRVDAPEECR